MSLEIKKFNSFNESKLSNISNKYIDYYYLKDGLDIQDVRSLYELIEDNSYRAIATFSDQIHLLEELNVVKIALVNYPPKRNTKRHIKKELLEVDGNFVDEVEIPWVSIFNTYGEEYWREIILDSIKKGVKIRAMLEIALMSNDDIKDTLEFLLKIGIRSILTSTGLVEDITTLDRWNDIKDLIPRIFETKVIGIITLNQIQEFLDSDVNLCATTLDLKTTYEPTKNEDDDIWDLPTNY